MPLSIDPTPGPWVRVRSFARAHRELPGEYLRRILRFEQRLSMSRHPPRVRERRILRGGLLSTTALVGAAALVWASPAALAGPTGGTVVAGNATISTAGATTQITTNSQRTIINWTGVSLKPGETMSFVQPSVSAATLNRVTGNEPSLLQGTLSSNGQVYLINPNGIVVGQPFSDAPQSAFVHFKTWYSVSEPFNGAAFTVFFKEAAPDVLPDGFEAEVPFDQLLQIGLGYPIGFGMLYGQQNRKSPDAIAQASSYDMLADEFSTLARPLYLDVENPKTELLGYELRPEVYAQNVLARISTAAGGDEVSCKELSDILPLIQNPQAQADYRTLCLSREPDLETATGRSLATPTRDRHFVRAVQR